MSKPPPPPGFEPAPPVARGPAPPSSAQRTGRAGWPPWLSMAGFVTGFGATIVVGGMVFFVATAAGLSEDAPGLNIGLTIVQNVALVAAAFLFAAMSGRPAAADFGLRRARLWSSVGLLVAVWVAFFVLSGIWAVALDLDQQQELPEQLGADGPLANVLAVVVLVTVIAPLGEELFFRGFFFGSLRNWHGPWLAALLTGIAFGVIHVASSPVGYLVPLMIFGVGLCMLYEWTGSLYPAIALHALNNSVALGANLHWSWQIPAMMVGSTAGALLCAWLLARALGDPGRLPPANAPAPGSA
ncbi:MAG TPA: CPBP family intramembrane glutamic endopeptidase [Solirubrobacteraceae bacterium]|nr:CPBP family intramembrane glutamic endopeptidase [Solirubrobacteraceae bacterium]